MDIVQKIEQYSSQLVVHKESIKGVVEELVCIFKDSEKITIYLTGIGKSGHIARKCAATWQSLGIRAHFLNAQDILHGDMGVLRHGDMILYISNSGASEELLTVAQYLKVLPVIQVSLTNNLDAPIHAHMNHSATIGPTRILEAGLAPSVSSVISMMILDIVGMTLAEERGYSLKDFQVNHPSGALGK
jgi:arabinose-5-phosphate isomerase